MAKKKVGGRRPGAGRKPRHGVNMVEMNSMVHPKVRTSLDSLSSKLGVSRSQLVNALLEQAVEHQPTLNKVERKFNAPSK